SGRIPSRAQEYFRLELSAAVPDRERAGAGGFRLRMRADRHAKGEDKGQRQSGQRRVHDDWYDRGRSRWFPRVSRPSLWDLWILNNQWDVKAAGTRRDTGLNPAYWTRPGASTPAASASSRRRSRSSSMW